MFLLQSNTSEVTLLDSRVDSVDSQDENLGHSWNRNNSVSVIYKLIWIGTLQKCIELTKFEIS